MPAAGRRFDGQVHHEESHIRLKSLDQFIDRTIVQLGVESILPEGGFGQLWAGIAHQGEHQAPQGVTDDVDQSHDHRLHLFAHQRVHQHDRAAGIRGETVRPDLAGIGLGHRRASDDDLHPLPNAGFLDGLDRLLHRLHRCC